MFTDEKLGRVTTNRLHSSIQQADSTNLGEHQSLRETQGGSIRSLET